MEDEIISQKVTINNSLDIVSELSFINDIYFTEREIDVLAVILGRRSSKKMAALLSVSPKTVESHIYNIMLKIGCSSRESIIEFLEKSSKINLFRQYFSEKFKQNSFDYNLLDNKISNEGTLNKTSFDLSSQFLKFIMLESFKSKAVIFLIFLCVLIAAPLFFQEISLVQWLVRKFESKTDNNISWHLPKQYPIFVGREDLLKDLNLKLNKHSDTALSQKLSIVVCSGLGGIGKTQLALQYIHNARHHYNLKAWFHAEYKGDLNEKFKEFAKNLGYNASHESTLDPIAYVKRYLEENPGWLLVFDNANNYAEIEPFLPEKGGHIIITTRQREWPSNFQILPVDVMTEKEAIKVIQTLTKRNLSQEEKEVKELVKTLGHLPLALVQAGAYIYQKNVSIKEYLNLYKNYEFELLSDNTFPEGISHNPVAITWNISLEAIVKETQGESEDPIAIELLTVCSYLAPDKIARQLLFNWLKETHPQLSAPTLTLNKHIALLWKYSMINYDQNNISIHRLVQTVLRHQLQKSFEKNNLLCPKLNLEWYEALLRFFIENENQFKLTNSFDQLLTTHHQFKNQFANVYNDTLAELDLISSSVFFFQEKYDEFLKLINEVNVYLNNGKGTDYLRCKYLYLYSAYLRKMGNLEEAQKKIDAAIVVYDHIKQNVSSNSINSSNSHKFEHLRAKLLFNKANLSYVYNKKLEADKRHYKELEGSVRLIKEGILLLDKIHDTRDKLRSIELHGRLLVLMNKGNEAIEAFDKQLKFIEEISDERTKMLFYLTYSDAYASIINFGKALEYCQKAKTQAEKLNLSNELKNIHNKEQKIIEKKMKTNTGVGFTS